MKINTKKSLFFCFILFFFNISFAESIASPSLLNLQSSALGGGQGYSLSIQILLLMTALTFLPSAIMMMTSFMRIVIVLTILRQAIGLGQTPTNQVVVGIAFFLTMFIMNPVFTKIYNESYLPYSKQEISFEKAIEVGSVPLKKFMINQIRSNDLNMFLKMSKTEKSKDVFSYPMSVIIPSFITSELKTSFQIGFMIFIPFIIVDLFVASTLMSLGMMMLSPLVISLPFKIILFVLMDGWALTIGAIANSFKL